MSDEETVIEFEHHKQHNLCVTRPAYRQGRKLTAIKTYTVNSESQHLLIFGVPSVNLRPELKTLCQKYGTIVLLACSKKHPSEMFTECFRVKYDRIQSARVAKRALDTKNFFGGVLHVCYAPEYETVDETRNKLQQRRTDIKKRLTNPIRFTDERNLALTSGINNDESNNGLKERMVKVDDRGEDSGNGLGMVYSSNSVNNLNQNERAYNANVQRLPHDEIPKYSKVNHTLETDSVYNSSNKRPASPSEEKQYEYVFKHKTKRKKKKPVNIIQTRPAYEILGSNSGDNAENSETIEPQPGTSQVIVYDTLETPKIVILPKQPVNRIVLNIQTKNL